MKIISRGTLPEDKQYFTTCVNCITQISFLRKEARYEFSARNERFLVVPCPVCNKEIWLKIT